MSMDPPPPFDPSSLPPPMDSGALPPPAGSDAGSFPALPGLGGMPPPPDFEPDATADAPGVGEPGNEYQSLPDFSKYEAEKAAQELGGLQMPPPPAAAERFVSALCCALRGALVAVVRLSVRCGGADFCPFKESAQARWASAERRARLTPSDPPTHRLYCLDAYSTTAHTCMLNTRPMAPIQLPL